jgi:signal transduction histidine kinase
LEIFNNFQHHYFVFWYAERIAQDKGIELVWNVGEGISTAVQGDATRVRQVLINLAGNALEFTSHGEVSIHAKCGSPEQRSLIHFTITDTGIGISAKIRRRYLKLFLRRTCPPHAGLAAPAWACPSRSAR